MIYKYLKKFRRVISLVVIVCVIIPFVSACGNRDNNLGVNDVIRSQTVGVGGNINAYTTYRQAKFMEMDKDMYYSYLLSYRSFILVVLPRAKDNPDTEAKESDYPNQTNLMFQAVYNGVSPYAEQVVNGDFSLLNPEYKLLIYYVLADDFLSWEAEAIEEENKSFITSALDYLGPSELKNYEFKDNMGIGPAVVRNKEKYSLKNITNMNSYVSECDFVAVNNRYEKERLFT